MSSWCIERDQMHETGQHIPLGKNTACKYVFHVANEKYFIHVLDTVLVEFKVNNKDI